mgnify:CR=1 FL=1
MLFAAKISPVLLFAATPTPNEFRHSGDWWQALSHTWDMACAESGSEIEKHFGVE